MTSAAARAVTLKALTITTGRLEGGVSPQARGTPAHSAGKDLKKILKTAKAAGFDIRTTKKGHIVVSKDGRRITTFAGTASDHRSIRNGLAAMRRAGFEWPPRR